MTEHHAHHDPEVLAAQAYRLILAGGLLKQAGLLEQDPATLLGGLLELARNLDDPERRRRYKLQGEAHLGGRPPAPVRVAAARPSAHEGPRGKHSIPHG